MHFPGDSVFYHDTAALIMRMFFAPFSDREGVAYVEGSTTLGWLLTVRSHTLDLDITRLVIVNDAGYPSPGIAYQCEIRSR